MTPSYNTNNLDPRGRRLAREHIKLHSLCERSSKLFYQPLGRFSASRPPVEYEVTFKIKSIIGIEDGSQMPIYGYEHKIKIALPAEFPNSGAPICYATTPVWHPNIKFAGPNAGYICTNKKARRNYFLDDFVEEVGEILQYKNYHAQNTEPHPEDGIVAEWIRTFAEPRDIVNNVKGIAVDPENLLDPVDGFEPRAPLKAKVSRIKIRQKNPSATKETPNKKGKTTISIKRKN